MKNLKRVLSKMLIIVLLFTMIPIPITARADQTNYETNEKK